MADNNKERTYSLNLPKGMLSYDERDPLLTLHREIIGMDADCKRCYFEQNRHGRYTTDMPLKDRVLITTGNIETGCMKFGSKELERGIREFKNLCLDEKCEAAQVILSKIYEDVVSEIRNKKEEERTSIKPLL
jgi:hypothetical protein